MTALWGDTPRHGRILAALLLAAFLAAPLIADRYLLSVLILVLYFAYVGQAWNLLMGFAGQLSLGHALYLGLGAYTAAALWIHFGIGPWGGVFLAIPISALCGAFIGWLGWRFSIEGVYFALLTIAFAEFTRIGFDHWDFTGASAGFFLPVQGEAASKWWNLPRAFQACSWVRRLKTLRRTLIARPAAIRLASVSVLRRLIFPPWYRCGCFR